MTRCFPPRTAWMAAVLAGSLGFLAAHSVSAASEPGNCTISLERAQALLERQQPAAAQAVLMRDIARCRKNAQVYNLLGVSYDQQGHFESAKSAFREAAELAPEWPAVRNNLGSTYLRTGQSSLAVKEFSQALKLDPHNRLAALNLATIYLQQKDYARSCKYFLLAGAPDSNDPAVLLGLASTYFATGDQKDGLLTARRLSEIGKGNSKVKFSLGLLLAQNGYYSEAVNHFNAVPPAQRDFAVYQNLGLSLMALRRFREAQTAFEMALHLSPNNLDACLSLGQALLSGGQMDRAIYWLSQAYASAPKHADIDFAFAEALIRGHRYEQAVVVLQDALRVAPENPNLLQASGDLAAAEHNDQQAIARYQQSLKHQPGHVGSLLGLASVDKRLGREMEAWQLYQRVLTLSPGNASANTALGQQALAQGQLDHAEKYFTDAVREDGDLPEANEGMAEIDLRRNDYVDAEEALRRVLRDHPNDKRAHYLLGKTLLKLGRKSQAQAEFELSEGSRAAATTH